MIMGVETTTITTTEHRPHTISGGKLVAALLTLAVALGASATPLRAAVSIHGNSASVHLEASGAPVSEVLSALESAFPIRYRASVPLDETINGTYRGSLRRVLSRLLNGYNYYVADTAKGGMEITIVGRPGAAVAVATPRSAPPQLVVPPPTPAQVAAERQRLHHRRPP